MKSFSLVILFALAAMAAPFAAAAQAPPEQIPDSVRRLVRQLEVLEARLGPIEQMALTVAPDLSERSNVIQTDVVTKMLDLYPSLSDAVERLVAIQEQQDLAQQRADVEGIQRFMAQGTALADSISAAKNEALQDPGLRSRLLAYQEALVAKMIEVDPNAELIIEEMNSLQARIEAADIGG